ncbi:MAG TPA: DUF1272 domain-containing protein [Ilumatobacteraceae bacterium]|jgi:hypothetical protein|nr:DUF1272 domain-containing protein [Ilumatobacteraceae bacterium]
MALELRPICENCAADLPPASADAMICSFECTFCRDCVEHVLENVCPNCGGGFAPRPIRPSTNWKSGNSLAAYPASTARRHRPLDVEAHVMFARDIKDVRPSDR